MAGGETFVKATRPRRRRGPIYYLAGPCIVGAMAMVFKVLNEVQPGPYLDEVFHIPQTQRFCNGSFHEWDDKITTLPGTYILASGNFGLLNALGLLTSGCSVFNLRMFNGLIGLFNMLTIYEIVRVYLKNEPERKQHISAINICLFPVLFFFNFLFYTDVLSTLWVLLMHLTFMKNLYKLSALCGLEAIFTRQINVVWVGYHGLLIMTVVASRMTSKSGNAIQKKGKKVDKGKTGKKEEEDDAPTLPMKETRPRTSEVSLTKGGLVVDYCTRVLKNTWAYGIVIILFIGFVVWNKGIVVGDRKAHTMSINIPQLGYFTLVFGLFCSPYLLIRIKQTLRFMWSHWFLVACATLFFIAAVHFNTVAHPYLLADNRHYPFYVWKRLYQSTPCMRYLLIPFYVFVWSFICMNSPFSNLPFYPFPLVVAAAIQLVPQLLLEFRYFILIYIFARMSIPKPSYIELTLEFAISFFVNCVTIFLFLYHPFRWHGIDELQRFMW